MTDLQRPTWLDAWQDYPHGSLDEQQARELSGYSVRLEDEIRALRAQLNDSNAAAKKAK